MKTQIKRFSKSTLAVVLSLCMLISCMTVGIIATDAAKVSDSGAIAATANDETVGATTYYMHIGVGSAFRTSSGIEFTYDSANSLYYASYNLTANSEYPMVINTTSGTLGDGNKSSSSQSVVKKANTWNPDNIQFDYFNYNSNNYDGYDAFKFKTQTTQTVYFTFTSTSNGLVVRSSLPSGTGGGSSGGSDQPSGNIGAEVTDDNLLKILNGTDISFYIESYTDREWVDLCNSDKSTPTYDRYGKLGTRWGKYYVQIADKDKTSYFRITNNKGDWNGDENSAIKSATGGEHFITSGTNNVSAVKSYTTINSSYSNTDTMSISTRSDATKTAFTENNNKVFNMTLKYYIKSGSKYYYLDKNDISASTTAKSTSYSLSNLSAGNYTLITLAVDSENYVRYIADSDDFTVTAETKHSVTFSAGTGGSISPNTATEVGESTATTVTATASEGYAFSSWTNGSGIIQDTNTASGDNQTQTIRTNSTGSGYTVQANFTAKTTFSITTESNNNSYGSVTTNISEAYEGQTVTVTITEGSGTFKSVTATADNGTSVTLNGTGTTRTFTMPAQTVTVEATFEEYSADSNFYYNSYGSNGQPASTHYGARMTEAKLGGQTYSYYHVTGRTESEQLFTISYGDPAHNGTVYFVTPDGWEDTHGWNSDQIDAAFYASDEKQCQDWSAMESDGKYGSDRCFKISIPKGARYVQFRGRNDDYRDGSNCGWPYTAYFDLNDLADKIDCIYISKYGVSNGQYNNLGAKNRGNTSKPISDGFYEYFNSTHYTNNFSSGGFQNHNATRADTHNYTKPNNMDAKQRGDYYVLVLYKGKTYTINGVTHTVANDPEIIWLPKLPSDDTEEVETVDVYAKDGAIRYHDSYGPYHTLALMADTELSNKADRNGSPATFTVTKHPYAEDSRNNGKDDSSAGQDYQTGTVNVGDIITVTTTIKDAYKDKYYVKGFVVNGKTPEIYNWNSSGVYTLNYEITGDEFSLTNGNKLEITPVFFLKDDTNTINFSIEGFTPDVQGDASGKKWGNTMYVYPFYADSTGKSITGRLNAFGSYPGQPLVFDGGKYYIQVPKTITYNGASVTVQGVTMSNGYWDHVHREVIGWLNSNSSHRQTYDYDDFYKISNELSPDNIIYEFKYKDAKNNDSVTTINSYSNIDSFKSTFTNGWENLVDAHGRQIDVFGNVLSTEEINKPSVYVVSKGYHKTNAGDYATEWEIFYPENGTSTTKIVKAVSGSVSAINPSALVLENSSKFAGYGNAAFSTYSGLYDVLNSTDTAKKHPVQITYESERQNSSGDIAQRSDGQWYHSKNNDIIHANIIIEYLQADGSYKQDSFEGSTNVGSVTGAKAYFTNEETNADGESYNGKTETGDVYSNNKEFFTFAAEPSSNYEFVEWKRLVNGVYYDISGNSSPKTSIDIYVARFRTVKSGNLTVSHTLLQDDTYKGSGTTEVQLEVVASNSTSAAATYSTGFKTNNAQLTSKYIKANSTNYVRVTLKTTPTGEDTFNAFLYNGSTEANATFFASGNQNTTDGVATKVMVFPITALFETTDGETEQTVNVLQYQSRLNKTEFKYEIQYNFKGRLYGDDEHPQWYVAKGTFTSTELSNYVTKSDGKYYIASNFISSKKPYERDFMRDLTWDFGEASTKAADADKSVPNQITLKLTVEEAKTTADSTRTAIFKLPYYYNPNNNYVKNDYIPVAYREKRTNTQGGSYYVTTGYYYTAADTVNGVAYADYKVNGDDSGQSSKTLETALYDGIPVKYGDAVPTFTVVTTYGKRFTLDNPYIENDKASTYVVAASSVYDNGSVKYFSYWKVTSFDGKEITRCYNLGFNFSAYENYIIEPIYDSDNENDHIIKGINEAKGATISFLDSSRNQWNEGGRGSNTADDAKESGDVLFKDFAIAYSYKSEPLNDYKDENVRVGMVVERVAELQKDSNGQYITTLSTYRDLYGEDSKSDNVSAAIKEIKNRVTTGKTNGDTHAFSIKKIASNTSNDGYGDISDKSIIDNKNRLKYYYALYNSAGREVYNNKNYIYRAFAYIAVNKNGEWSASDVEVSEPVYFTFYDIASK